MISWIRKSIALKMALIIVCVVFMVSTLFLVYLNRINAAKMYEALGKRIENTSFLLESSYRGPLWNFDLDEIDRLNEGVLNIPEIIAVNVYDKEKFFSGHLKSEEEGKYVIRKLQKPFDASVGALILRVQKGVIFSDGEKIGNFDIFFTERSIAESNREAGVRLFVCFSFLAVMIIVFIYVSLKHFVIAPVTNLAGITKAIADTKDYSIRTRREGMDELAGLYSGFNGMLEEISKKEREGEQIFSALRRSEGSYRFLFDTLGRSLESGSFKRVDESELDNPELTSSLNLILETLEKSHRENRKRDWIKTGQTVLGENISGESNIDDLCRNAIGYIAEYVGALVGTLFVREEKSGAYMLMSSYAFTMRKGLVSRLMPGEGLVGQAALEKKRIIFTEIPENYVRIESSLGSEVPRNIVVLPLIYEDEVVGVLELGFFEEVPESHLEFLELVSSMVAVAVNTARSRQQLTVLLDQTRLQSDELRQKQEELTRANEELEEQTRVLSESEARLQVQQEELQASNEEMEEKNEMLERQKGEIEKSNRELLVKQREVEEKARQLEMATKYKSEFLSNMSHELRTPLNSMLLLARMLSENEEKNLTPDQVESAESIHRSGNNLLRLINDILDLSKIEAGRIELSISKASPGSVALGFKSEFGQVAKEKGLKFEVLVDEDLPETIVTDQFRLEQVIRNLLGNAFKFTEEGGVTLKVHRPQPGEEFKNQELKAGPVVSFSVIDTGPGIPREKLAQIFEAFRQVDGSISRRHGGTGLGLSISRELTRLIGGELIVESDQEKGTSFTVHLPEVFKGPEKVDAGGDFAAADVKEKLQARPMAKLPDTVTAKRDVSGDEGEVKVTMSLGEKTMLIIEDDPEFAGILSGFFEKNGYDTVVASSGETGIRYLIDHKPTAVILDIGLPGIDGWAVLNELKSNPETRHIPVHIMSAYDFSREGLSRGAVGYLTKPVSTEGLRSAMERIEDVLRDEVKELLVVEDDKDLRTSIMKLMGTQDIRVTATGTGVEALELLKSRRFDCMILDLGLPDITGFELLDRVEDDEELEKTPVIIYTGRDLSEEELEKLEKYSSSIVLKSAASMERLLDETTLFMHRVENEMPEKHQMMIRKVRDSESVLAGKKVLLVDDDMRNAFALNKFLKSRSMEVVIANNGKKAMEVLERGESPDIILMDIMMPVMDGFEAMKSIRALPDFADVPILALTAKAMESDREECIRCGASDYLSKPVDVSKLLSMLRVWLY